jgi:hypothetical protein
MREKMHTPEDIDYCPEESTDTAHYRVRFGLDPASGTIYGWPAKGGIYVLRDHFGVALDFLGLHRVNNTIRPNQSDPTYDGGGGAHCNKSKLVSNLICCSKKEFTDFYPTCSAPAWGQMVEKPY